MKRFPRSSVLGVTLLEIMLVLAIAAMVIVMSIRYYQSATTSQQANAALEAIQAIAAGMDNLAIGTGDYTKVTTAQLTAMIGANNMKSPTGGDIVVTSVSATTYTVAMPLTPTACTSVQVKVQVNVKITIPTCSGSNFTYTYDSTK